MFEQFERINTNLYEYNKKYYRLFGAGITPNGCWVIAPKMVQLLDIESSTGNDIYGESVVELESGVVPSSTPYARY